MTSSGDPLRPGKLWKQLSDERKMAASEAFWTDAQAAAEQAEMLGIIARQINFRPKSVVGLPLERKTKLLAKNTQISDMVAARLLVAYHLAHQRPMMKAFLDGLGLAHEDGLINDEVQPPSPERVLEAGKALFATFEEEDVRLYFSTLLMQDPEMWGSLQNLLAPA